VILSSDDQFVLGIAPHADRHRFAGNLTDLLTWPRPGPAHGDLDDVVGEESIGTTATTFRVGWAVMSLQLLRARGALQLPRAA
jgi:hypothetical protein